MNLASFTTASAFFCLATSIAVAADLDVPTESREWKSADGNFSTTATLAGFLREGVLLEKGDGKTNTVPFEKLSGPDQAYARGIYRQWLARPTIGVILGDYAAFRKKLVDSDDYKTDAAYRTLVKSLPSKVCLLISQVAIAGPAEKAGLKAGDLITHINDRPVKDGDSLTDAMMLSIGTGECQLRVLRRDVKGKVFAFSPDTLTLSTVSQAELLKSEDVRKKAEERKGPLQIVAGSLGRNILKKPTLILKLKNASGKDIIAYTVAAECFNNFDEKVIGLKQTHVFRGISQDKLAAGKEETATWDLTFQDQTTRAVASIVRIKFADGEEWNAKDGETPTVTVRPAE